jgi:hypothetical protein
VDYIFDQHAVDQMKFRGISKGDVLEVLENPHQIVDEKRGRKAYQSIVVRDGRFLMLRVFVAVRAKPPIVVSVYLTSKGRYWNEQDNV